MEKEELETDWVGRNAKVIGNSEVSGKASVFEDALVYGDIKEENAKRK